MAKDSNIAWCSHTWNPVTGCTQVSPGCDNCYALALAERYRGQKSFPVGFDVQLRPHKLREPIKWKEPARIFVNSMSDLFHRLIPDDYLRQIWDVMLNADHHTYMILTKRAHRMRHKIETLGLATPPHIWLGVSAENQKFADSRIPALVNIPVPTRFISAEPLLGPVNLTEWLNDLAWIVAGGESGPNHRPMNLDWARQIRDDCVDAKVAFFYKQNSHYRPEHDRVLDGQTWDEYPDKDTSTKQVVDVSFQQALI